MEAFLEYSKVQLAPFIAFLKITSYVLSAAFFAAFVVLIVKLNLLGQTIRDANAVLSASAIPLKKIEKKWRLIEEKFSLGDEANTKLAIIEADKTLDYVLETMGYRGTSMGERLEKIKPAQFPMLEELWKAHKVRNAIVHDTEYHLTRDEAEKAMETFRSVLNGLEVI